MENNVTSTLFHLVTMRAPELITDRQKDLFYIKHPDVKKSAFAEVMANPANETIKASAISNYSKIAFKSVDAVKSFLGDDFFDFANWLTRNRDAVSKDPEYITSEPVYRDQKPLDDGTVLKVWDNLFYQALSHESAYVREQMIQALVANLFLRSSQLEDHNQIAVARVVMPKELFNIGEGITLPEASVAPLPVYTKQLEKDLDQVIAKNAVDRAQTLVSELRQTQQQYTKDAARAYTQAKAQHEEAVTDFLRRNTRLDEQTGIPKVDFYAGDAPVFKFSAPEEVTEDMLVQRLSPAAADLAKQLDIQNVSSFDDAIATVEQHILEQHAKAADGSKATSRVLSVNNTLIPVSDEPTVPSQQYSYVTKLVPEGNGRYRAYLAINMAGDSAHLVDASYNATQGVPKGLAATSLNQFTEVNNGSTKVIELFPGGLQLSDPSAGVPVNGKLVLSSGLSLDVNTQISVDRLDRGVLTGVLDDIRVGGGVITRTGSTKFIPSGYGIQRLGIADYRKIEQTLCCYVPGEVSHIENVMAREFKERSTRRLRRSEETITTSSETERERLTDTTTADRFELQQQMATVINESTAIGVNASANVGASFKMGPAATMTTSFGLNANYAHNTSKQQSNSQAVNTAKEMTQRALDRVVQKVREERISKVVEEFEEQNKHGFDNRAGDAHVSGVYRWVDKIYKNQVYNYGKRLMYEFMIPQPAVFHMEAMKNVVTSSGAVVLEKPVDPRSAQAGVNRIASHKDLTEYNYSYWAGIYNADIDAFPGRVKYVGKNFSGAKADTQEFFNESVDVTIPEGYVSRTANIRIFGKFDGDNSQRHALNVTVGNISFGYDEIRSTINSNDTTNYVVNGYTDKIPVAYSSLNYLAIGVAVSVRTELTDQAYQQWQVDTFQAIIDAYTKKLNTYNDALASMQVEQTSKGTNPMFYRQIENNVLRKNCMDYLVGHANLGKDWYASATSVANMSVTLNASMDKYASLVKFMEQAFEWELLSYNFYPFYWAGQGKWQDLYQQDADDELFRAFLQSGMARAILTVRPGFEEAVMHYMATGEIWDGGQVPVIGDNLYLSIVDELKEPAAYVDETWETRVPSTLTVIQAGTIGLDVQGLPCDCDDDPATNPIKQTDAQIGVVLP